VEKYRQRLENSSHWGPALAWAQSMQDVRWLGFFVLQRDEASRLHAPFQPLGSYSNTCTPRPIILQKHMTNSFRTAT